MQLVFQILPRQAQVPGRGGDGTVLLHGPADELPLVPLHLPAQGDGAVRQGRGGLRRGLRTGAQALRQIRLAQQLPLRHGKGPLHRVAQLADIARPPALPEHSVGPRGHPPDGALHGTVILLQKMVCQQRDVLRPLPQGRQEQAHHPKAVKEILPQAAGAEQLLRRLVHRRHDAHVKGDVPAAAQTAHLFLLQGLEQLGLEGDVHGVDLVQKEGAAVGLLKEALVGHRAGIAALLRAEEHALQQVGGYGRAVLGHEGLAAPPPLGVEGLGHQLLAGARLPVNQHRGVQLGSGADAALELLHPGRLGYNPIQGGQAAPAAAADDALAHHIEAGAVHRPHHLSVHRDGDGGSIQHHPLPPAVHNLLPLVVDGPAGTQGAEDGAALLVQLRIELPDVAAHRLLRLPIVVHGNAVIPDDPVPIHNQDPVGVLTHLNDRPDLIHIRVSVRFRHALRLPARRK